MRKQAKKPAILDSKIKLAYLLRKSWNKRTYHQHPDGFYWSGEFDYEDRHIRVYVQHYTRRRLEVHYVSLHWKPEHKALTPTEIKALIIQLTN